MPRGQAWVAAFFLALFAGAASLASTYPPDARLVPLVFAVSGAILSAIQLVRELRSSGPSAGGGWRRGDVVAVAWFGGLIGMMLAFGFTYGAPVVALLFLLFHQRLRLPHAFAAASGLWLMLMLVEHVLGLALFDGLLARR